MSKSLNTCLACFLTVICLRAMGGMFGFGTASNAVAVSYGTNGAITVTCGAGIVWTAETTPPPWSPLSIPDCVLWIDFTDAATITLSGASVMAVTDKSPGHHDAFSSNYPTTGAGIYEPSAESVGFLSFSGDDYSTVLNADLPVSCPYTKFVVLKCTFNIYADPPVSYMSATGDGRYPDIAGNSDDYLNVMGYPYSSANYLFYTTAGQWDGYGNARFEYNELYVYGTQFVYYQDSSTVDKSAFKNGVYDYNVATYDDGTETRAGLVIGGNSYFAQRWKGNVYEVIYFSRALSAAECSEVEAYLGAKYGVNVTTRGL